MHILRIFVIVLSQRAQLPKIMPRKFHQDSLRSFKDMIDFVHVYQNRQIRGFPYLKGHSHINRPRTQNQPS